MPSRKLTAHCPGCGMKNHLRAQFCNQCGKRLDDSRAPKDSDGRAKLYADIAHPINSHCREMIQDFVIQDYYEEIERAKQPGYVCRYDDYEFEYSDAPRPRPARFDAPHHHTAEAPHVGTRGPAVNEKRGTKPPFYSSPAAEGRKATDARPSSSEGFGAGIFPM
jgi:stage V sporulation protein G